MLEFAMLYAKFVDMTDARLKVLMEKLYRTYNKRDLIVPDPLQFPYQYKSKRDKEVVAFFSAIFAYGRVALIQSNLENLFAIMNRKPFEFVKNFSKSDHCKFANFKYRFNTSTDVIAIITALQRIINQHGSIEKLFLTCYDRQDENVYPSLGRFVDRLIPFGQTSRGLKFLLPGASSSSASKRLNMFLRWMVRDDDVDLGLWKKIDKAQLIIPVDVHIARLSKLIGLTKRKTAGKSTAIEITKAFAKISPDDPVKYDFALSRIGIVENCNGKYRKQCHHCQLFGYCLATKGCQN